MENWGKIKIIKEKILGDTVYSTMAVLGEH